MRGIIQKSRLPFLSFFISSLNVKWSNQSHEIEVLFHLPEMKAEKDDIFWTRVVDIVIYTSVFSLAKGLIIAMALGSNFPFNFNSELLKLYKNFF